MSGSIVSLEEFPHDLLEKHFFSILDPLLLSKVLQTSKLFQRTRSFFPPKPAEPAFSSCDLSSSPGSRQHLLTKNSLQQFYYLIQSLEGKNFNHAFRQRSFRSSRIRLRLYRHQISSRIFYLSLVSISQLVIMLQIIKSAIWRFFKRTLQIRQMAFFSFENQIIIE